MNLSKKKKLAAKALKVGKNRIIFNKEGLSEIKEAITKQDIKDLYSGGIISIKPVKGRRKIKKRKTRRGPGKIKKKVKQRKQIYIRITRKLREYLKELKKQGNVNRELYQELRKKIKMKMFRSKAYFKDYINNLNKENIRQGEIKKKDIKKIVNKKQSKKTTKPRKEK